MVSANVPVCEPPNSKIRENSAVRDFASIDLGQPASGPETYPAPAGEDRAGLADRGRPAQRRFNWLRHDPFDGEWGVNLVPGPVGALDVDRRRVLLVPAVGVAVPAPVADSADLDVATPLNVIPRRACGQHLICARSVVHDRDAGVLHAVELDRRLVDSGLAVGEGVG